MIVDGGGACAAVYCFNFDFFILSFYCCQSHSVSTSFVCLFVRPFSSLSSGEQTIQYVMIWNFYFAVETNGQTLITSFQFSFRSKKILNFKQHKMNGANGKSNCKFSGDNFRTQLLANRKVENLINRFRCWQVTVRHFFPLSLIRVSVKCHTICECNEMLFKYEVE